MITSAPCLDERHRLLPEFALHALASFVVLESLHVGADLCVDRAHADGALCQAEAGDLIAMPRDEERIDGDQTERATQHGCVEHRRFAETHYGDVERGAGLDEPRLLEMTDDERVVALLLSFDAAPDRAVRATKLGERAQVAIGGRHPAHFEADVRRSIGVQRFLQPQHVGLLLMGIDEALIADPRERLGISGTSGISGHRVPPR